MSIEKAAPLSNQAEFRSQALDLLELQRESLRDLEGRLNDSYLIKEGFSMATAMLSCFRSLEDSVCTSLAEQTLEIFQAAHIQNQSIDEAARLGMSETNQLLEGLLQEDLKPGSPEDQALRAQAKVLEKTLHECAERQSQQQPKNLHKKFHQPNKQVAQSTFKPVSSVYVKDVPHEQQTPSVATPPNAHELTKETPSSTKEHATSSSRRKIPKPRYSSSKGRPSGRNVLVCEDDSDIRQVLALCLEDNNCHVLEAEHGMQALEILAGQPVDLLITDLRMPEMDGIEMIQHIHSLNENIPIIVISGLAERKDIATLLDCGITDFIEKPFTPEYIKYIVNRILREQRMASGITKLSRSVFQMYYELNRLIEKLEPIDEEQRQQFKRLSEQLKDIEKISQYLLRAQAAQFSQQTRAFNQEHDGVA